jgi:PAS domain S-box-containing protein
MKVAVADSYAVSDWIPRDFPDIQLVKVKNVQEGLEKLQGREVSAYVGDILVGGYYLAKLKMTTLKIAGNTPYVNAQSMAVRKDWATLAGILDKALDSISETERNDIYRRWMPVRYEYGFDYTLLWRALAVFAVILLGIAAWVWKLTREIAGRRKAEAALSESERRFRQLFQVAPMPLGLINKEGAVTEVNDRWVKTFGYTREDIPTISEWWRLAFPDLDYRRRVLETWEAAVRRARGDDADVIVPHDYRVTCKNGDERMLEITGTFLGDDILAAFFDITDRKAAEAEQRQLLDRAERARRAMLSTLEDQRRAQKALRESEERSRNLLEVASAGIAVHQRGRIVFINPAGLRILGAESPGQLIGKDITAVIHPDTLEGSRNRIQRLLDGEQGLYPVEDRYVRMDGSPVDVEVMATRLLYENEPAVQEIVTDITERKHAEEALKISRERLLFATEGANLGIWNWNIGTGELTWSNQCKALFCIGLDETMSYRRFRDALHPDDREMTDMAVKDALDNHKDYDIEYRSLWPDGSIHWLAARGRGYYDSTGKAVRMEGVVLDITDRKRAEEALRQSEEKFSVMFRKAPLSAALSSISDLKLMEVNEQFEKLWGYSSAEAIGKTSLELGLYPDTNESDRLRAIFREKGFIHDAESKMRSKSGELRDVLINSDIVKVGNEQFVLATVQNITERKQLEIERQKFFLLAESSSEFIGMCDLDMNPLYVNPAGRRMVGLPDMAAACRVKVQDYYFPEDQRFIAEEFFPRVLREGHGDVEIRLRHFQTGEPIWVFYYLFSVHDASGTPLGWATVSRDITERRQAEESLRTYAERLKNLHRIDQAILKAIDSPETITREAILRVRDLLLCQRVSVGMFDFKKKEVRVFAATGNADSVVQTGQVFPEGLYGDLGILRQNQSEIIEDSAKMETVPVIGKTIQSEGIRSSISAPILSPEGLIGVLSIGWDTPRIIPPEEQEIASEVANQISIALEQARLQQEIKRYTETLEQMVQQRTAQLEAANKELEAFSYSVSHDLRGPLRAVDGYTRMLLEDYQPRLDAEGKRICSVISDSARDMGKLIDDLLAFSRVSRTAMQPSTVDMAGIARSIFFEITTPEGRERIDFKVGPLPSVVGDPTLIRQVWVNLLGNAVKFSSKKARAAIEVSSEKQGQELVFCVRDNGAGFDMKYAAKLFGVFQRLHSTSEFEGTGVGLAIIQRIIDRHGGRVWARGEPGKGAAFYFTFGKGA